MGRQTSEEKTHLLCWGYQIKQKHKQQQQKQPSDNKQLSCNSNTPHQILALKMCTLEQHDALLGEGIGSGSAWGEFRETERNRL